MCTTRFGHTDGRNMWCALKFDSKGWIAITILKVRLKLRCEQDVRRWSNLRHNTTQSEDGNTAQYSAHSRIRHRTKLNYPAVLANNCHLLHVNSFIQPIIFRVSTLKVWIIKKKDKLWTYCVRNKNPLPAMQFVFSILNVLNPAWWWPREVETCSYVDIL